MTENIWVSKPATISTSNSTLTLLLAVNFWPLEFRGVHSGSQTRNSLLTAHSSLITHHSSQSNRSLRRKVRSR
ncbi:MAG: hypothetical protein RBR40_03015 [Tenuifilaceae bacterium]|nr:hypothetical protein [Tenuifilaceae bacterium]